MTKVTFEDVFDGLQILPSRDDTEGKFIDILEKQKELMEFAIANHSKVMQIRFDLHYPSDGFILPSSDDISVFSYNLSRRLKRMVIATHRVDPLYLWVREIHDSSFPHYHFLLWINANAIKNKFTVFDMANKIWKNTLMTNEEAKMLLINMHGDMDIQDFLEAKKGENSCLEMKYSWINCVRNCLQFLQENLLLKRLEEFFLRKACRMLMLLGLGLL